jgi:Sugar (and other) transporter
LNRHAVVLIIYIIGISFHRLLPESPRWLVVHGRYKEAANVLRRMCVVNLRPIPDNIEIQLTAVEQVLKQTNR